MKKLVLDMDSSVSETYGRQEGTAYNGHFGCMLLSSPICFNQFGDVEILPCSEKGMCTAQGLENGAGTKLSPDTVIGGFILISFGVMLRSPIPNIYEYLEGEHFQYVIRLSANDVLHREIEHLMTRPDRASAESTYSPVPRVLLPAAVWSHKRRVIAKVEWHRGELFPRVGFIVTNLRWRPKNIVHFYNHRGTAEQCIKKARMR